MVHIGSVSGVTGPTIITLKGKNKRTISTEYYLVCHILSPGVAMIMTQNYFMANDECHNPAKYIINCYKNMTGIRKIHSFPSVDYLTISDITSLSHV